MWQTIAPTNKNIKELELKKVVIEKIIRVLLFGMKLGLKEALPKKEIIS